MENGTVWVVLFSAGVLLLLFSAGGDALTTDGLSLLALKAAVYGDPSGALAEWRDTDGHPCGWKGVTCRRGRVIALALGNFSLAGYLPSELSLLSELESLELPRNRFAGPIPAAISGLRALKEVDLSSNALSGPIPAELGALKALTRLDLSSNLFNGTLPVVIASLPGLEGVLNLSCNRISGGVPPEYGDLPVTVSLDLRRNNLSGEIPQVGSLVNQGPTAFSGNPNLCGFPLRNPCPGSLNQDPKIPSAGGNVTLNSTSAGVRPVEEVKRRRTVAAVPILVGVVIAAVASVLVLQWQFRRRRAVAEVKKEGKVAVVEEWRREGRSGEIFVAVDEGFALELEELLRASAYVVGKSRSGIVYKVVVGGRGAAVAVRRLSEGDDLDTDTASSGDDWRRRRAFEAEAMAIGRVKHPNVVTLRAYYYAPDEKLLIYDYIPNGSLHFALHGNITGPSPNLHPEEETLVPKLQWAARLVIIQGAARGLAYLHECSPRKYIHGSIKSSKILLDDDWNPYISGFGLTRLMAGSQHKFSHSGSKKLTSTHLAASGNAPYLPPEARVPGNPITQKCDVYAFGIVLLEVLTGRLPGSKQEEGELELEGMVRRAFKEERPLSEVVDPTLLHEVYAKKQVVAVFHVALGCTESDPEMRPRMRAVSESLDRIGTPPLR